MASLIIKPRSRLFHGHEWVYSSEVRSVTGSPEPGDVVTLRDVKNRPLGSAIFNPASAIVARRFSRRAQDLDADFFRRRIARAAEFRTGAGFDGSQPYRIVWSEADGLPGVIIDRYGSVAVLQTLTLAMDLRRVLIADAALELPGIDCIFERNDSPIRKAEGMEPRTGVLAGALPEAMVVASPVGVRFQLDLAGGQKTGLYLDQFDNYAAVAQLARGATVLDCFANQGGFALHAAHHGAASVLAIDISEAAVAAIRHNAGLNGVNVETECANVFDFLKSAAEAGRAFDLIILDPPSFTRNRERLGAALRGYKEIHLRALQMLNPGGRLATFCCSHHVSADDFHGAIAAAAVDAKRTVRELGTFRQRGDHPVLLNVPETQYLKGYLLEVLASW